MCIHTRIHVYVYACYEYPTACPPACLEQEFVLAVRMAGRVY
jgi:hypothetical protein